MACPLEFESHCSFPSSKPHPHHYETSVGFKAISVHCFFTGERLSAQDAERAGLVSKVFPVEELVNEAVNLGEKIAGMSQVAVAMAKEAVNAADNLPLSEGQWL